MSADRSFRDPEPAYRHEAMLYHGDDEFVDRISSFIRDGLANDDAILTVVDAPKIDRLRARLDGDADRVRFADMADVGHNPALIIQAWRDFVSEHASDGVRLRGVGEPISSARHAAALVECHTHESLLNLAFDGATPFWLLCPYDTSTLSGEVIEHARANHRSVLHADVHTASATFRVDDAAGFEQPLPRRPHAAETFPFDTAALHDLRDFVLSRALAFGFTHDRASEFVLAADEIATNSVTYGGMRGTASVWGEGDWLLCEIQGGGRITDPLVGRLRPLAGMRGGYGIWLANQMCDLVQIRSTNAGTTVRLHARSTSKR